MVRTVLKPWGREIVYARTSRYAGKILMIEKGRRLSLQYHRKKQESVYVLKGALLLEIGGRKRKLFPGQSVDIPAKAVHRFCASGARVTLLEVSTPELGDVVRLEDDYGRLKSA